MVGGLWVANILALYVFDGFDIHTIVTLSSKIHTLMCESVKNLDRNHPWATPTHNTNVISTTQSIERIKILCRGLPVVLEGSRFGHTCAVAASEGHGRGMHRYDSQHSSCSAMNAHTAAACRHALSHATW